MIKKDNKELGFIYKNNENIDKIYKNNELIFEQGFTREQTGNAPLTTAHTTIGKNLKDYKIYGNNRQYTLPSQYQEVEYIATTDRGPYIDTGFFPNENTRIRFISSNNSWAYVTRQANEVLQFGAIYAENAFRSDYGNNQVYSTTQNNFNASDIVTCDKDKNICVISNGLKTITLKNTANAFQCVTSFLLFANNQPNTITPKANQIIYSCTIWDNGTMIRNLIPCYRKSDDEIGMYDLINNVFYTNVGTGEFSKGNNGSGIIIDGVGDELNYSEIPAIYQEVEYIESTGTQYIQTDIVLYENYGLELDADLIYQDKTSFIGAAYNSTTTARTFSIVSFFYSNLEIVCPNMQRATTANVGSLIDGRHIYKIVDGHIFYFDGQQKANLTLEYTSSISTTNKASIFWAKGSRFSNKGKMKCYNAKFYDNNGVILGNFIPCYRKSDGVIGMYDKVSSTFYTNDGTGTFLKGADKVKYKIPMQTVNGNVENIYLDKPLRKAGNFADYLDYKNQKIYRNIIVNNDSSYSTTIDTTGTSIELPALPTNKNSTTTLSINTAIKPNVYIKYKGH